MRCAGEYELQHFARWVLRVFMKSSIAATFCFARDSGDLGTRVIHVRGSRQTSL